MVHEASEEYVTYETFYTLNKQYTSESSVAAPSGSSLFYDLDGVAKRKSYSAITENIGISTINIFRALNTKGNEWPRAPSEPVQIVQECTTRISPKFPRCDDELENTNKVKSDFLRECVLSSGICLKDSVDDSESSSNAQGPLVKDDTGVTRIENFVSYQAENTKYEGHKRNKEERRKRIKDPCLFDIDELGCHRNETETSPEVKTSKSLGKQKAASNYREEVFANNSKNKNKTHLEDKLTRMSGDGLSVKYAVNVSKNDTSCILIMDAYDIPKISLSQISSSRKSGVRLIKVLTNKIRVKPKKSRALKCPNCYEHIEFTVSTEDEASTGVQAKSYRKSETAFTYMASKDRIKQKIEFSNECPHGCEMVPLCQILPKVNFNESNPKHTSSKKTTPRFIKMTKACRHYPPCAVVPSCQRNNVMKANCEIIPPCCHRPRCLNLPLCIPFCKNLQYDENTKKYVDYEEKSENCYIPGVKYIPVSQYKLYQPHVVSQKPNAFEPRAYYVNQTHLSCQVPPLNTNQCDNATKSCQYVLPKYESNNAVKEDATDASVVYIRDVGCQFKNSNFTPHTSYFQTRVCYTSSASFDPGSKRLDNIYTNPKAFTCEPVLVDGKSKLECTESTTKSLSSSGIETLPSQQDSSHKRSSKIHPKSKTSHVAAFCMLRNGEGGYLVPVKPKRNSLKGKCKNKFTLHRRQVPV